MYIAQGDIEEALEQTQNALMVCNDDLNKHMQSTFQGDFAYIQSLLGHYNEANTAAIASIKLRAEAGGPFFSGLTYMMAGATYIHLNEYKKALFYLDKAIKHSKKINNNVMLAGAYTHKAYLMYKTENICELKNNLKKALILFQKNEDVQFPSLTPGLLKPLLVLAVHYDIEKEYAKKLSKDQLQMAILGYKKTIPILRMSFFGDFSLTYNNKKAINTGLSNSQKEFLALLVSSHSCSIDKEKIMCLLWPEKPERQMVSSFDTFIYRLKNTLKKHIQPHDIKNYLFIEKGRVFLENITVDTEEFYQYAVNGLMHFKKKNYWQAENYFRNAIDLFGKNVLADVHVLSLSQVENYKTKLNNLKAQVCHDWAKILISHERCNEAVTLLEDLLVISEEIDSTVKMLYRLYLQANEKIKAVNLLNNYKNILLKLDFPQEEIKKLVSCITESS